MVIQIYNLYFILHYIIDHNKELKLVLDINSKLFIPKNEISISH